MSNKRGTTPGLRVPLKPSASGMYLLAFGLDGARCELVTTAQLMTLVVEAAKELGLAVSAPPRKP